jgi:SAM-dependent methyltransferase
VVSAFEHGCGVPYDRYTRFHQVMAEDSEQTVVAALEPHLLPLVPELRALLERGATALDVGCGSGMALVELGRLFPRSSFRGYDLSWEAVVRARRGASAAGLRNVTFELRDCAELGNDPAEVGRYDVVFAFDAVHDQARPDRLLQGIHRVLRSDGIFLMQDIKASSSLENNFDHPAATLLYTISCMHCMSVSLAQQDGIGLGAMWGKETALRMLEEAGFGDVATRELAHDFQNLYYVCRPRPAVRAVRRQPNSEAAASL